MPLKYPKMEGQLISKNYRTLFVILGISCGIIAGWSLGLYAKRGHFANKTQKPRIINPLPINYQSESTVYIENIFWNSKAKRRQVSTCSGSIIDESAILTAAHCFAIREDSYGLPKNLTETLKDIDLIRIHVGVHDKNLDAYLNVEDDEILETQQRITINHTDFSDNQNGGIGKIIKINPDWFYTEDEKIQNDLNFGDIAIINLPTSKTIDLKKTNTKPVHVFSPGYHRDHATISDEVHGVEDIYQGRYHHRNCSVVGYGFQKLLVDSQNNKRYDYDSKGLGTSNVYTISREDCIKYVTKVNWTEYIYICYDKSVFYATTGHSNQPGLYPTYQSDFPEWNKTRIAKSDSGGPIFTTVDNQKVQLGVTSNSLGSLFAGFIEIEPYLAWIGKVVPGKIFERIEDRIIPARKEVEDFNRYEGMHPDGANNK